MVAWTVAALGVVVWPALWPALAAALAVLGALVAWDALLLRRRPTLVLARQLPARAILGREAEVLLQARNDGSAPLDLEVIDEAPADLIAEEPRFVGVVVRPGESTALPYRVRPSLRGERSFGPLLAFVRSPLGLLRQRTSAGGGASLRVYPDATAFLRSEALDPKRVLAALGVRPSRRKGEGMEFESLREYVAGDDPRRVDWAATARRGRPITRLYQHERNHVLVIALDASRLMAGRSGDRSKIDHAVDAALALAYAALASGDRVGMVVFDREVRAHVTSRAHRSHLGAFVELLATVQACAVEADYRSLVRSLAVQQRQRALIVVLTDFVEVDAASLLDPLVVLGRRHRVLLVALRDRAYGALGARAWREEESPLDLYRRLVLDELLRDRDAALATLGRSGIQTLDLAPEGVTASVLNRYLAIRRGPEL